jgi:hypothetical protein
MRDTGSDTCETQVLTHGDTGLACETQVLTRARTFDLSGDACTCAKGHLSAMRATHWHVGAIVISHTVVRAAVCVRCAYGVRTGFRRMQVYGFGFRVSELHVCVSGIT